MNIMGFFEDFNFKGNEFGNVVILFFVMYVVFEVSCFIVLKFVGLKNFFFVCMLGWGIVCFGMGFIKNV